MSLICGYCGTSLHESNVAALTCERNGLRAQLAETAQERDRLRAEVFDMRRTVTTQKVLHDDERAAVAATLRYIRGRIDCAHPDIQRACDGIDKLLLAATPGEKS